MNYIRSMVCFRLTLGLVWGGLLALINYGSFVHGDEGLLSAYGFLIFTFPFGLIWALVAFPSATDTFTISPDAQMRGMIAIDAFTLFFWLILVPLLWSRYQKNRHIRRA